MELSVIIVSFNVRDYLKKCLASVREASKYSDCEIFVVDNNSTDDSCKMVIQEFPEVILISNNYNHGFSAANNQALKLSKGRFVLLLNPDTIIEKNTFIKCIGFMNNNPDAGSMGVKMNNGEGRFLPESKRAFPTPSNAFFKTFGLSALFPASDLFSKYYLTAIDKNETSRTEIISGAFMFIRLEVLKKTGFLDEDYFMYGEDIDLSYRIIKAGYNNYYYPGVEIIHFKGKSTNRKGFSDIGHFYKAMRIYVKKHSNEKKLRYWKYLLFSGIYLREWLARIYRLYCIISQRNSH